MAISRSLAQILVVDDHLYSRLAMVDILRLGQYEVIESDGSGDILAQVAQLQPDLILLNIPLGHQRELALCQHLKSSVSTASIPVILTTVVDDTHLRQASRRVGADACLVKPLETVDLLDRVDLLIQKKQLAQWGEQIEAVLFRVAEAIDERYAITNGRLSLGQLVCQFGEFLHLAPLALDNLLLAARLHDLGTVKIPDMVMLKAGPLTSEELALVRQHVLVAEKIFEPLASRQDLRLIMRHHHERWDGSGYPDGLRGDEIPYLAQVFQIMDIFNALTTPKAYKPGVSTQEALSILEQEKNRGWRNPALVCQFMDFISQSETI